jgi:O-antigen ligase
MLMVLVGEVHGVTSGGDMTTSLWEVRAQIYMFVAYVLACNLVKTRRQVDVLTWILLLGGGIKGVQGTWRWLITLHGDLHKVQEIFPHEQSFFFNAVLSLTAILFLYGGSRRMKRVALLVLPCVIVASLANQRRAAIVAFAVSLAVLLIVTAVVHPIRRRALVMIVVALAVAWPPYYAAFKNRPGLAGEIAHAVASASSPDPRDASSNLYRVNEDKDIMATMRTSPVIGYGFGKPMQTPYPLADISGSYIFWNILPHDSILWVWMRLGTVGYTLLWFMIGTAIVQAARLALQIKDPYLKGLAVWIMLLVVQQVVFGYLDLQWTNYRNLITLGILFALPSRLAAFASATDRVDVAAGSPAVPSRRMPRKPYIPHTLSVIDGRLR